MSVICISSHNECIYDILQPVASSTDQKKAADHAVRPMYVGHKRLRDARKTVSKNMKPHGTMGLPRQPLPDPHDYLKKRTGKPPMLPQRKSESEDEKPQGAKRILPPVPARDDVLKETSEKIRRNKKNFLVENVKKAVKMAPKIPVPKVTITKDGIVRELTAGLEPQHLTSDVYGKIPPYLDNLIKIKQQTLEREKHKTGIFQPKCIYITRDERENLLAGLKENWEELQRVYQGLPILTDTIPKILRKSKMESELKQLEKDIVLIERHPYIYVYDDEQDL